jgi:hypothetical protein
MVSFVFSVAEDFVEVSLNTIIGGLGFKVFDRRTGYLAGLGSRVIFQRAVLFAGLDLELLVQLHIATVTAFGRLLDDTVSPSAGYGLGFSHGDVIESILQVGHSAPDRFRHTLVIEALRFRVTQVRVHVEYQRLLG